MHERQQDAMSYVRKYGHPDLFITTRGVGIGPAGPVLAGPLFL